MSGEAERKKSKTAPDADPRPPASPVEAIGSQLKGLFNHVADQPIPTKLADLVDRLETDRLTPGRDGAPRDRRS